MPIGRARLSIRLLTLALRVTVVLMLAGALFLTSRLVEPAFVQLVDGSSRFMGVPVQVVLGVLLAGLAVRVRRHLSAP